MPTFTGFPATTLCEQYPNFNCETQIGTGTQFPKASLLGTGILTGNICVIGNFEVDAPLIFQDALIKISSGVAIAIRSSENGYESGSSLGIDNSKLFACNGLWKGISLGHLSSLSVRNNTEIEDAETAITASGLCALNINRTTFNRNLIGISLSNPFPGIFSAGPMVWEFGDNRFTCNAPITGTVDQISYCGINMNNAYLYTSNSAGNIFEDIGFGIICNGQSTFLGANNLVFNRIRNNGINMKYGYLNLKKSSFNNCARKGIYIETAYNVSITDGCVFRVDDNVLPLVPDENIWYAGIEIGGHGLSSRTKINGNYFNVDFLSKPRNSNEILIYGIVNGGSKIAIQKNHFHSYGQHNHGIVISTNFPGNTLTAITENIFDIKNVTPIDSHEYVPAGIVISGNQNNLNVFDNTFFNVAPVDNYYCRGIQLAGSEGSGNSVSNNHFDAQGTYLGSYSHGIIAGYFKNTTFCSNDFLNSETAFSFVGANEGTNLSGNIVYGGQLVHLGADTWIEDQPHKGNQWFAEYNGAQLPVVVVPQAYCNNDFVGLSQFFLHLAQSTAFSGAGFNPFHPKDIDPDIEDEWWKYDEDGIPTNCIDWQAAATAGGDSNFKRIVSDGIFNDQYGDSSQTWQAERSVYFALKHNPVTEATYPAYSAFRSSKESGSIGKLYEVATGINDATSGNPALVSDAEANQAAIDGLIIEIDAAEQSWQNAVDPTQMEAAKNLKVQKLNDLRAILQTSANLQTIYESDLAAVISIIQEINNSIDSENVLEDCEKTVNTVRLMQLLNGEITEEQLQKLLPIASLCPKDGGMAVFQARMLIPACLGRRFSDEHKDCNPVTTPLRRVDSRSEQLLVSDNKTTSIAPNPASDVILVTTPTGRQGKVKLINIAGSLILEKNIVDHQSVLQTSGIPMGIYYIRLEFADGNWETHKLIIQK